jgi:hypothetical protein
LNKTVQCGAHNLYAPPTGIIRIKSRRMKWADKRNAYRILVGNQEGQRPLGRPRPTRMDTIELELKEIGCGGINWINLAGDRDQ